MHILVPHRPAATVVVGGGGHGRAKPAAHASSSFSPGASAAALLLYSSPDCLLVYFFQAISTGFQGREGETTSPLRASLRLHVRHEVDHLQFFVTMPKSLIIRWPLFQLLSWKISSENFQEKKFYSIGGHPTARKWFRIFLWKLYSSESSRGKRSAREGEKSILLSNLFLEELPYPYFSLFLSALEVLLRLHFHTVGPRGWFSFLPSITI